MFIYFPVMMCMYFMLLYLFLLFTILQKLYSLCQEYQEVCDTPYKCLRIVVLGALDSKIKPCYTVKKSHQFWVNSLHEFIKN